MPDVLVVDDNDRPVGAASRQEIWKKGLPHRIVRIMLEDGAGHLLLQKRSAQMETAPNCWDHAAAGHVDEGEDYDQAAYRELAEELGMSDVKLQVLASYHSRTTQGDRIFNRFNKVYRGRIPYRPLHITNFEVAQVRWFTIDEVKQLIKEHPKSTTGGLRYVIDKYY